MGIRPLKRVRWKFFIAIAIHLKLLTTVANISVDVAVVLDPPLTTVYYLIIKAILTSLMPEF